MSANELRTISLQTIPDAIRVINESSKATSLEYHLDFFSFLSLQGYWNFSSTHSLIRYIDGEPAAIILTCADSQTKDAYILYWGAVSKFRTLRIAQELFEACCSRLFESGYLILYGVSSPDRPVRRYRFIQAMPQNEVFDMQAESVQLPPSPGTCQVRQLEPNEILQISASAPDSYNWSQRPNFLLHVASRLQFFGVLGQGKLKAYAAVLPSTSDPLTLIDLRSSESDLAPGYELLRHIFTHARPPYLATNVFDQSYAQRLLTSAGFDIKHRFFSLVRDLRSSSPTLPKLEPESVPASVQSSPRAAS